MIRRRKFLGVYLTVFALIFTFLYTGLKTYQKLRFSPSKVSYLLNSVSPLRDRTDDLCKYYMRGDPDAGTNYVKVNFYCYGDRNSKSTLDLSAIDDKSINGVLSEYARIIGFDFNLIAKNNWFCLYDSKELTPQNFSDLITPPGSIDCYQSKELRHD